MTFLLSILAGAIGAAITSGIWPERTLAGALSAAFGLIGGTLVWVSAAELHLLDPSLPVLLMMLIFGGIGGALFTLGAGSLRNIVFRIDTAETQHPGPGE